MDCNQRVPLFSLLLYLFLIICCLLRGSCSASGVVLSTPQNAKVSLELYYETLCPYCSNFIANYLDKLFLEEDGLGSVVDLKLIPYGNARIGPNSTISCQHGPFECLLNTVEACAISVWPDVHKHFWFIYCIETLVHKHKFQEWERCYEKLHADPQPISDCYTSEYGTELELQYANDTNSLEPPHEYVPWVVVDGQPLYEDYENFIHYICKAYTGTAVPKACKKESLDTTNKGKAEPTVPVFYKETTFFTRIRSGITSWTRKMKMEALM